ncbi:MAG: hypothetical protein A2487_15140 [Candidatus Raymondbacteria bacterium RifOxyC12_full_50_8]|nr:MAG: hypothetical protein A2487_15140 [Candidatus Raymondbacteria bacterium RifOxyC12_full_50_8]
MEIYLQQTIIYIYIYLYTTDYIQMKLMGGMFMRTFFFTCVMVFLILNAAAPCLGAQKRLFGGEDFEKALAESLEAGIVPHIFRYENTDSFKTEGQKAVYKSSGYIGPTPFLSNYFYRDYYLYQENIPKEFTGGACRRQANVLFAAGAKFFTQVYGPDWSGYDHLLIDVRSNTAGFKIKLQLEDREVEPPVVADYIIPAANTWYTLKFDLNAAVQSRSLDLTNVTTIQLLCASNGNAYADNFRLVTSEETSPYATCVNQHDFVLPPLPAPVVPPVPDIAPDLTTLAQIESVFYEPAEGNAHLNISGFITAFDKQHIAVGYTHDYFPYNYCNGMIVANVFPVHSVFTLDGGSTWQGSKGPGTVNLHGGFWYGNCKAYSIENNSCFTYSSLGCAGPTGWHPRQFIQKMDFKGSSGWSLDTFPVCVDADMRHCGYDASFCYLPSGRWWMAFGGKSRLWDDDVYPDKRLVLRAKYSNDQGISWHSWQYGKTAAIPGMSYMSSGRDYTRSAIVPYGDHVAILFVGQTAPWNCLWWTYFDGTNWSTPQLVSSQALAGYGAPRAISINNQIYVTARGVNGVMHWNGSTWTQELASADNMGYLTRIGSEGVALVTYGSDIPESFRVWTDFTGTVRLYRRDPQTGSWGSPEELSGGPITLNSFDRVPSLYVPPSCPSNMLVVGWNIGYTKIKILKIPYDGGPTTVIKRSEGPIKVAHQIDVHLFITGVGARVSFGVQAFEHEMASMDIYDIRAKKITNIWKGPLQRETEVRWDGRTIEGKLIAQGMFIIKVTVGGRSFARAFMDIR